MNLGSTRADAHIGPAVDAAFLGQRRPAQQPSELPRARLILACAGLLTLFLGLGVYVLERNLQALALVPTSWQWATAQGILPAALRDSGPSFAHVMGFSLISAAVLAPGQRVWACAVWLLLDGLLECAQQASWQALLMANGLHGWPAGRFDTQDLVALLLGGTTAAVCIRLVSSSPGQTPHV